LLHHAPGLVNLALNILRDKMLAAKKLLVECKRAVESTTQIRLSGDA
jgi:hypothetical protein